MGIEEGIMARPIAHRKGCTSFGAKSFNFGKNLGTAAGGFRIPLAEGYVQARLSRTRGQRIGVSDDSPHLALAFRNREHHSARGICSQAEGDKRIVLENHRAWQESQPFVENDWEETPVGPAQ
jgi:hypothetical protein